MPESSTWKLSTKISANNFALSDAEDNNSGPLHTAVTADFSNLPRVKTIKFLRGDRLQRFIGIS